MSSLSQPTLRSRIPAVIAAVIAFLLLVLLIKQGTLDLGFGGDRSPKSSEQTSQPADWVPLYPGMTVTGSARTDSGEKVLGTVSGTTPDDVAKVRDHYNDKLKADGYSTKVNTTDTNGVPGASVSGNNDDHKSLEVAINRDATTPITNLVIKYTDREK